MKAGFSLNIKDKNGDTPLHWAVAQGHRSCILKILTHWPSYMGIENDKQEPPVRNFKNHLEILPLLLNIAYVGNPLAQDMKAEAAAWGIKLLRNTQH